MGAGREIDAHVERLTLQALQGLPHVTGDKT